MNDLESWLMLMAVPGVGPARFRTLVSTFGSPRSVLAARAGDLLSVPGIDGKTARSIGLHQDPVFVEKQMRRITDLDIDVLFYTDPRYPRNLRQIYDAPPLLFVRGSVSEQDGSAVAVVGSRVASEYGKRMARLIAGELAGRGITVVSGLARGIDTAAHRSCLERGGRTIAVLGCGVDVVYPAENGPLMNEIIASGAVISEFPMGTPPEGSHFPRRNRIISGLSLGVVVVEAAEKSGALVTAEFALNQNREVFAVPGQATSMRSRGSNRLIKEGAKLVTDIDDILEELQSSLTITRPSAKPVMPEIRLSEEEHAIYEALTDTPLHIDAIARQTRFPSYKALSLLLSMELNGTVKQLSGKMFLRA